jgi:hypothetical protein
MGKRVRVLPGPQVRRSWARQAMRLGLDIVTASKRVHDGWCSLAGRRGLCTFPEGRKGIHPGSMSHYRGHLSSCRS